GCWVGFKAISETVESSASIISDIDRIKIITPDDFEMPPGGLSIRWPDPPLEAERRLHGAKMEAVAAFARANRFDRIVLGSRPARLGIMATGKAYLDLRQALADLGITDAEAQALGLRIYKVALTWPLEVRGALAFAEGLQDVLVVEEKRGFIEDQLIRILYNMDASKRPSVVGKRDESGAVLLPSEGELTPTMVAAAVVARLRRLGHRSPQLEQRLAKLEAFDRPAAAGVNNTYKILYNDAVAMTGGQPAEGGFDVAQIAHQVAAEGAKRLAIVTDDPDKYPGNYFPPLATVHHRRELDAVQRELRDV